MAAGLPPDDLFARHSVAEVKNIHARLRCVRGLTLAQADNWKD